MDILNWLYLRKNQLIKKTVNNATTDLVVLGADATFARRDDKYKTYAMTVEDFATAVALPPAYKVYTALLTQSGGDDPDSIDSGNTVIGVTYTIDGSAEGDDFRNIGGPLITYNGEFTDYSFVATGTTPNNWVNTTVLRFNTGAPVVTVLENTIGNIWFIYDSTGYYGVNSNELFIENKTTQYINSGLLTEEGCAIIHNTLTTPSSKKIFTVDSGFNLINGSLNQTPIEIRVYN